jgi:hypothetical protein
LPGGGMLAPAGPAAHSATPSVAPRSRNLRPCDKGPPPSLLAPSPTRRPISENYQDRALPTAPPNTRHGDPDRPPSNRSAPLLGRARAPVPSDRRHARRRIRAERHDQQHRPGRRHPRNARAAIAPAMKASVVGWRQVELAGHITLGRLRARRAVVRASAGSRGSWPWGRRNRPSTPQERSTKSISWRATRASPTAVTALRDPQRLRLRMLRVTPDAGVAASFRSALESGRDPRVFEDGAELRDVIAVEDVAHATALALVGPPAPTTSAPRSPSAGVAGDSSTPPGHEFVGIGC